MFSSINAEEIRRLTQQKVQEGTLTGARETPTKLSEKQQFSLIQNFAVDPKDLKYDFGSVSARQQFFDSYKAVAKTMALSKGQPCTTKLTSGMFWVFLRFVRQNGWDPIPHKREEFVLETDAKLYYTKIMAEQNLIVHYREAMMLAMMYGGFEKVFDITVVANQAVARDMAQEFTSRIFKGTNPAGEIMLTTETKEAEERTYDEASDDDPVTGVEVEVCQDQPEQSDKRPRKIPAIKVETTTPKKRNKIARKADS